MTPLLLGVRHHGPGSARAVRRTSRLRPRCLRAWNATLLRVMPTRSLSLAIMIPGLRREDKSDAKSHSASPIASRRPDSNSSWY